MRGFAALSACALILMAATPASAGAQTEKESETAGPARPARPAVEHSRPARPATEGVSDDGQGEQGEQTKQAESTGGGGKTAADTAARPAVSSGDKTKTAATVREGDTQTAGTLKKAAAERKKEGKVYRRMRKPSRRTTRRRSRRRRRRRSRRWQYRRRSPFRLRRGPFSIEAKAQIQVQAVTFIGKDALFENGDPASDEGVLIRRARLGVQGTLPWDFHYKFIIEAFGDTQRGSEGEGVSGQSLGAQILDLSLTWQRWKQFQIGVGADKVPGPKGRMVSSYNLQLVERPLSVEAMVPDRRAGGWFQGDLKIFNYLVGIYNGDDGLSFGNEGGGYLVGARLELTPFGPMGDGFPDFMSPRRKLYRTPRFGAGVSFQYAHGTAADRMSVSGDLGFKWRGLSVVAEAIFERQEPLDKPTQESLYPEVTQSFGTYGQVGYFILPAQLEVAVRFEYLDLNMDIDDTRDVWALTGGVNYYFSRYLRGQLAFTHKEEVREPQLENDVLLLQLQAGF